MSEVYVNEPPLNGKVILHTSLGEIEIDLWSRECPKACKNFVQLCMEGYYDNNIFHRIIKDFLVQTGDPTGTGKGGCDTIYGGHYADEFHSRLKFRYRGLVGVANMGRGTNTNGNQFFITLSRADGLNNESTLFGKVVGNTIYNLVRISESQTNSNDRPIDPPFIKYTEVVINPFEGSIIPRDLKRMEDSKNDEKKNDARENLNKKRHNLLSFEEEEDEEENKKWKVSKSAHDLLADPKLLKETAYDLNSTQQNRENLNLQKEKLKSKIANMNSEGNENNNTLHKDENSLSSSKIEKKKFHKNRNSVDTNSSSSENEEEEKGERLERKKEIKKLTKEILTFKKGQGSVVRAASAKENIQDADLLSEYEKRRQLYLLKKNDKTKREKEANLFAKLEGFNKKLKNIISEGEDKNLKTKKNDKMIDDSGNYISAFANLDEAIDGSDRSWLYGGGLKFAIDSNRAYEIDAARDALEVYDPLAGKDADMELRKMKNLRMKPSMKRDKELSNW